MFIFPSSRGLQLCSVFLMLTQIETRLQVLQISHPTGSVSGTLISIRRMRPPVLSLGSVLEIQRWAPFHVLSCLLYRGINPTAGASMHFALPLTARCLALLSTLKVGFNRNVLAFVGKQSPFDGLRHVSFAISLTWQKK